MSRYLGLLALAGAFAITVGEAQAGRPRGGVVMTPFGPLYNTNSAEWKNSGGNPILYQQLMEQKMLLQQQQMYLHQQQAAAKAQKNVPTNQTPAVNLAPLPKRKKKRTYVPTGSSATTTTPATTTPKTTGTGTPSAKPTTPATSTAKP
jgi:hypothetical protein